MVFGDPFFASIVQGVAMYLANTEYTLNMMIAVESRPDKTRRYLMGGQRGRRPDRLAPQRRPLLRASRTVAARRIRGPPLAARDPGATATSWVLTISPGERGAIDHLIERGRKAIGVIAGPQDMPPGLDRLEGWRQAVRRYGMESTDLVEYGDFTPESGADAMRRLLSRGVPIDAIVAANDQMAVGAYTAIREHGLTVPDDIAVVGFDDNYFGLTATPTAHDRSPAVG